MESHNPLIQIEQIVYPLTWRIRQQAMYPHLAIDEMKLANDAEGIHFGLYFNHELVGVVSMFITQHTGQFRKFAVLPSFQRRGLGSQLLNYLIDFANTQQLDTLWCNARVNAKAFYLKAGFKETDQIYSYGEIDFIKLERHLSPYISS